MTIESIVDDIAAKARKASRGMASVSTEKKNRALKLVAEKLVSQEERICEANRKDLDAAAGGDISDAFLDRLRIDGKTVDSMVQGLKDVMLLDDPVGKITASWTRPNGLKVERRRIPLGVVAMIYESRPNVTVDAAALCLKAGNCSVLRGGSEAFNANMVLAEIIRDALLEAEIDRDAVQVIPVKERGAVDRLLKKEEEIDLVIPRGGESLIRFVVENSAIPVLKHYKGVCHVYVDREADRDKAVDICFNAKVQRPGVCNAMETMLVHAAAAETFLPRMGERFRQAGVEIRGCPRTCAILKDASKAEEADYYEEYLDLVLAVKVVDSMDEAIDHIGTCGSAHTDVIVTDNTETSADFVERVASSMVGVNVSTRFNDGGQLGLGAEIGISTTKLHAFGPMGLEELTTTKFVVTGEGQLRE